MVQIAFFIETVIYIFGGSYQYFPKIIKHNAYYDSNVGALVSNLMIVPTLAVFIAVFELNWIWKTFFVLFLTFTEILFVNINIYVHYWWKTIYTTLGLFFVYFPLGKAINRQISNPLRGLRHSIFLFLCTAPILGLMNIMPIMWLSNRAYIPGWFKDPARDTTAFASLYHVFNAVVIVSLIKMKWKNGWLKYILVSCISIVLTLLLKQTGILHSYVWWDQGYYIIYPVVILRISETMGKSLWRGF
jgi:hypothetical protein